MIDPGNMAGIFPAQQAVQPAVGAALSADQSCDIRTDNFSDILDAVAARSEAALVSAPRSMAVPGPDNAVPGPVAFDEEMQVAERREDREFVSETCDAPEEYAGVAASGSVPIAMVADFPLPKLLIEHNSTAAKDAAMSKPMEHVASSGMEPPQTASHMLAPAKAIAEILAPLNTQARLQSLSPVQQSTAIEHLAAQIIANQFSGQATGNAATMAPMRFHLSPQFLGEVHVDIAPSQIDPAADVRTASDVRIIAQTQAAYSLLLDHRAMLAAALGARGADIASVDVQQASGASAGQMDAIFAGDLSAQQGQQGQQRWRAPHQEQPVPAQLSRLNSGIQISEDPAVREAKIGRSAARFA
jgi:hypothetical protein